MELIDKVKAVEELFNSLDKKIAEFQTASTLHCKFGCGKCCLKPDIEATALEFLPFAFELYKKDLALDWLERLQNAESPLCIVLNPAKDGAGLCSEYTYRGLICRLFGYSARTNKYGKRELVTCQVIKTEQTEAYEISKIKVQQDEIAPVMNQYYMQLHAIDYQLAQDFYPINRAIQRAIETVLHYYAYRN